MPIVVRLEDIDLSRSKLEKDILYEVGPEEGKQIGIEKCLFISVQEAVLVITKSKLGYVLDGVGLDIAL